MHKSAVLLSVFLGAAALQAKVVVFWQDGFPTVESQPVERQALEPLNPVFAGIAELQQPATLQDAELLVLPYGSAFPAEAWKTILAHLRQGGSLLNLGGRPLCVPVVHGDGRFTPLPVQHAYARHVGVWHTYEAPQRAYESFAWDADLGFLKTAELRARRVFVLGMGRGAGHYQGLGFLLDKAKRRVAAAVTAEDYLEPPAAGALSPWGSRCVFLAFEPEPGYWATPAGMQLIRESAEYAAYGGLQFWLETHHAAVAEGEAPQFVAHLRGARFQRRQTPLKGTVRLELLSAGKAHDTQRLDWNDQVSANVVFRGAIAPGHYVIRGTFEESGRVRQSYHTGFWVRDPALLGRGPRLGVKGDYFLLDSAPFLALGTNYFSTDIYNTGFFVGGNPGGNAYVWERDFAEMAEHHVNFARTGIWLNHNFYLDRLTGAASERLLRALEAFLHSAARHNVQVHFTFFAFDPQTIQRYPGQASLLLGPGSNPYTDPAAIRAQQHFISSIVERFKDVPILSWDLINEPSFSNPRQLWRGNTPNADPTEMAAWNRWLEKRYGTVAALARAWGRTEEEFGGFGGIPLPEPGDLTLQRDGNDKLSRAVDYNLFAQDAFNHWAAELIAAIRRTGSRQLVTVGQDEGGVTSRVLNQFYADSGVDFTVNHSWWRDDALLWDSVAAKRPDKPNLIGETGVQPVWRMDATWRWDEPNAMPLFERKMALGFAAANAGALHWDWARGDTFGILRRDGSFKSWADRLAELGEFARKASPHMKGARPPEVAIVLPQSLQLSVFNNFALEAQQNCVRALYHYSRSSAYAAGEYQIRLLGNSKLIILPSPWVLHQPAWEAILARVREGAVLLLSGRFDADEHFQGRDRHTELGLDYRPGLLATREFLVRWPGGEASLSFARDKTTYLERGVLAAGATFAEKPLGKGKVLYFPVPLELNENLEAVGEVYRFALARAGVRPLYTTETRDPGVLIAPTALETATLYVLTSESSAPQTVAFRDAASGTEWKVALESGRAAALLVGHQGILTAAYNYR